jgi:hypothetical protein
MSSDRGRLAGDLRRGDRRADEADDALVVPVRRGYERASLGRHLDSLITGGAVSGSSARRTRVTGVPSWRVPITRDRGGAGRGPGPDWERLPGELLPGAGGGPS